MPEGSRRSQVRETFLASPLFIMALKQSIALSRLHPVARESGPHRQDHFSGNKLNEGMKRRLIHYKDANEIRVPKRVKKVDHGLVGMPPSMPR